MIFHNFTQLVSQGLPWSSARSVFYVVLCGLSVRYLRFFFFLLRFFCFLLLTVRLQGARSLIGECRVDNTDSTLSPRTLWLRKSVFNSQVQQGWSLANSMRWHGLSYLISTYSHNVILLRFLNLFISFISFIHSFIYSISLYIVRLHITIFSLCAHQIHYSIT